MRLPEEPFFPCSCSQAALALAIRALVEVTTFSSSKIPVTLGWTDTFSAHFQKFGAFSASEVLSWEGYTPALVRVTNRMTKEPVKTSAMVSLSLPPKYGFAFFSNGSSSLTTLSTAAFTPVSISSSVLAEMSLKMPLWNLEKKASTKKAIRARASGPSGELVGGTKCDGYASARSHDTMADSGTISPLYEMVGTSPRGLIFKYSGVRGLSRSTISSLNGRLSSESAM